MIHTALLSLGSTQAAVDYELLPGELETRDCPGTPDDISIIAVRLGEHVITDPDSVLADHVLDGWREQLLGA